MSDKEIAEIRKRHQADTEIAAVLNPELPPTWTLAGWRAHNDRATLLAEVERLRAYVTQILLIAHQNRVCRNECGRLCREALGAKPPNA